MWLPAWPVQSVLNQMPHSSSLQEMSKGFCVATERENFLTFAEPAATKDIDSMLHDLLSKRGVFALATIVWGVGILTSGKLAIEPKYFEPSWLESGYVLSSSVTVQSIANIAACTPHPGWRARSALPSS